jgi:hypothetical protein
MELVLMSSASQPDQPRRVDDVVSSPRASMSSWGAEEWSVDPVMVMTSFSVEESTMRVAMSAINVVRLMGARCSE